MIVKNPTTLDCTVTISGIEYTVKANSELKGVPSDRAEYWVKSIHKFLQLEDEKKVTESNIAEKIENVVETVSQKTTKK